MVKKFLFFIFLIVFVIESIGCNNFNATEDSSFIKQEELLIFYEDGTENILNDFRIQYPNYEILMKKGNNEEEIEKLKLYYGEPDVILLNYNINKYEDQVLEEKYGCDLSELIYNDTSIDDGNYFAGTFSIGKKGDEILSLPLGISLNMMILREEQWFGSAFEKLEENYTGKDLLNAIEYEIDHEIENGMFINQDSVGISVHMLQLLDGIIEKEGKTTIDEELYRQLYNIWYKGTNNLSKVDTTVYEENLRANIGYRTLGAPQTVLAYQTSENMYWHCQETYVVYFPTMTDGGAFGACVQQAGIVGKNSEKKEQAYEFLRLLMDMPLITYSYPGLQSNKTFCPVNKQNAYMLLENFEKLTESKVQIEKYNGERYSIDYIKVSDRERAKLQYVLKNISFLYRVTDEERRVEEILSLYKDKNVASYLESYLTILNILNE